MAEFARKLDVEYWKDLQLNLWWKRKKLYELGYGRWRQPAYKVEGVDPFTGKSDTLVPLGGVLHLCPRCFSKLHTLEHVKWKKFFYTFPVRCDMCGRLMYGGYKILEARVTLHTLWHLLGKKRKPLRVDGETIIY